MEPPTPAHSVYFSAASSAGSNSPQSFNTPRTSLDGNDRTPHAIPPSSTTLQNMVNNDTLTSTSTSVRVTTTLPLERFINNTAITRRQALRSRTQATSTMPISSRLRQRQRTSQTPSVGNRTPRRSPTATTTPAPATIVISASTTKPMHHDTPNGPPSPIISTNMLRDVSPHSPSYALNLRTTVDQVVSSLMKRGRIKEGHGVRELYLQSFKDPGTAELLDALLRLRATERQRWDFSRFVDDVNGLGKMVPIVVVKTPRKGTDSSTLRRVSAGEECHTSGPDVEMTRQQQSPAVDDDESAMLERQANDGSMVADSSIRLPPSPRVVIENRPSLVGTIETSLHNPPSPRVVIEDEPASRHPHTLTDPPHMTETDNLGNSPAPMRSLAEASNQNATTTSPRLGRPISPSEIMDAAFSSSLQNVKQHAIPTAMHDLQTGTRPQIVDEPKESSKLHNSSNSFPSSVSMILPSSSHIPSRTEMELFKQARRKRRKNRKFLGANGPVYSRGLLDTSNRRPPTYG